MGMRFAVLQTVGEGAEQVVLNRDPKQVLERIQSRVAENLSKGKKLSKIPSFKHTREEIHSAVDKAWNDICEEFTKETISLP